MYIVTTTVRKPSAEVSYYIDSDAELKEKFRDFLKLNEDLILYIATSNDTDVSQSTVAVYESIEAYETFMKLFNQQFPSFFEDRDRYNTLNNIELSIDKSEN